MKKLPVLWLAATLLLASLMLTITIPLLAASSSLPASPLSTEYDWQKGTLKQQLLGEDSVASVTGIVQSPGGVVISGAVVILTNQTFWRETETDQTGQFYFNTIPVGNYLLQAEPPWGSQGWLPSMPIPVTITQPSQMVDVGTITLANAPKTVLGQVVEVDTSIGISNAVVWANRLDGAGHNAVPVDASGMFTLSLSGGNWFIGVDPQDWPTNWVFDGPPAWVSFALNNLPQVANRTLEVIPTNAMVMGGVVCPGGVPCMPTPLNQSNLPDPPPDSIWVELRNETIRNGVGVDPNYLFGIPIPDGWYELSIHVADPLYLGPEAVPVYAGPGGMIDIGELELIFKDSLVEGFVLDEMGSGVPGVSIVGWQTDGFGWSETTSDQGGFYSLPVVGGEWFIMPEPPPSQPYIYNAAPKEVNVPPSQPVAGINFNLIATDARIVGIVVDADTGNRLDELDGWAFSEVLVNPPNDFDFLSEGPMFNGLFALNVVGGEVYNVGIDVPPHAPYLSGITGTVTVDAGNIATMTVPLLRKDAVIRGQFIDGETGLPVMNIEGEVFGDDAADHWVATNIDADSGQYALAVTGGTWTLDAWIDPDSNYILATELPQVTLTSGQTVTQDFEVRAINTSIEGYITAPTGEALPGAFVFAAGTTVYGTYYQKHTISDPNGFFSLAVPKGVYEVGTALPRHQLQENGWIEPPTAAVEVTALNSPVTADFTFRRADGNIQGTLTFSPGITITPSRPAHVWAWAETGERSEAPAFFNGTTATYTLPVISDTIWTIGVVYEDRMNHRYYESADIEVPVPPPGTVTQDLVLAGPWPLPEPLILSFDATQMQTVVLADGVELTIPSGALADSGDVTLYIFPTRERDVRVGQRLVGVGYDMWATDESGQEISQFDKNIIVTLPYSESELGGVAEEEVVPAYYSTLLERWIVVDSYVTDTTDNTITFQIDHFSRFGTMGFSTTGTEIFLPFVVIQ